MAINCNCTDATSYRTLAQLRADLFARLGFSDPLAGAQTRTLLELRNDLMARLGFAAQVGLPPDGMNDLLNSLINEAQQTLWRRLELDKGAAAIPGRMVLDADPTTLDYMAVFNLALGLVKAHYGKADAKVYFDITEKYLGDAVNRRPPNAVALCNGFLQDAQRQIIRRYSALRMDRWFTWNLTQGQRFYDLPANTEKTDVPPCDKTIDQLAIKWVGAQRDTAWYPLRKGILTTMLGYASSGWPTHYDIKQCIEIWPAPSATEGTLRINAGFLATPFMADGDLPSVDDELVFLLALANAKAHWKQPDANNVVQQFEVHLDGIVAGSHMTARHIPGEDRGADMVYTMPRPTVPFS